MEAVRGAEGGMGGMEVGAGGDVLKGVVGCVGGSRGCGWWGA